MFIFFSRQEVHAAVRVAGERGPGEVADLIEEGTPSGSRRKSGGQQERYWVWHGW